ncbi:MAG: GNAT family N-acetyltransferase [Lysobacter sp.]|nr:GNAT family N-acetyltransferase [Lysobacter sp.]
MSGLATQRLTLRLLDEGDAGDAALYTHLYTDPAVMACVAAPLSADAAARAFAATCRHNRAARPGHRAWRIDGEVHEGGLGIAALRRTGDRAEIGVMLRQLRWGQGIAREALVAVLAHAFDDMALALVYGERPDDAQARLVDRMFAPLGLLRVPGRTPPDQARWELPRSRWKAAG